MAKQLELSRQILSKRNGQEVEVLTDTDIDAMTLDEYNTAKKMLEIRRREVAIHLDSQKMQQAMKIIENANGILDWIAKMIVEKKSALDLKLLTEAYERQMKALNMLSRFDTLDEKGTAAAINIRIEYSGG